jgi:hypothetical protein
LKNTSTKDDKTKPTNEKEKKKIKDNIDREDKIDIDRKHSMQHINTK